MQKGTEKTKFQNVSTSIFTFNSDLEFFQIMSFS